ncbi:MAG: hypothetical protein ACYSTZ_00005, partial [Planctomycetota bacterium]
MKEVIELWLGEVQASYELMKLMTGCSDYEKTQGLSKVISTKSLPDLMDRLRAEHLGKAQAMYCLLEPKSDQCLTTLTTEEKP